MLFSHYGFRDQKVFYIQGVPLGPKVYKSCRINVFQAKLFFRYGKPTKYFSFEKNVKKATHRGHFQFPSNPNKELTTSTNVSITEVNRAIYFKKQKYTSLFACCCGQKTKLVWSKTHKTLVCKKPWKYISYTL